MYYVPTQLNKLQIRNKKFMQASMHTN